MSVKETDVIIVGGGPVGLTLACELSYRGVNAILLERRTSTSVIAKAVGLNSRSMEHYRRLGIHDKIQNASFPRDLQFNIGMYTTVLNGNTNFKQEFASWGEIADGKVDKSYPFFDEGASPEVPMFCAQNVSEPVLKSQVEETSKCVSLHFGEEATSITQNDCGVIVKAKASAATDKKPEQYVYKAKYLALCDGGKGSGRKQLGVHYTGQFVIARACSIMFRSPEIYQQMKSEGKAGFSVVSNHEMNGVVITANDKGDFLMHIFLQSTASDEVVARFLQDPVQAVKFAMGTDLPFTIIGKSGYSIHSLVSTRFQQGRCFFAGDSAHQWLPAGGLGMNTGVSDVADLAWKLEAAIKGYGGSNLLASYEEERRPLDDSTRRFASFLGGNVLFESSLELFIRRLMTTTRFTRYFLGLQIGNVLRPAFSSSNQLVLGFQYSSSSIIMHEYDEGGNIVLHRPTAARMFSAMPGCRAPHVVFADSTSILDIFGKSFVLLVIGGKETDLQALKEEMNHRKIPFQMQVYPKLPELVAIYDRKYFLVRPDGVICWRSDTQPSSLESQKIMATVIGDSPRKRLSRSIWKKVPAVNHFRGFARDLLVRGGIGLFLTKYSDLSLFHVWAIGFGIFWLIRASRTSSPTGYVQDTSRHCAVVLDGFGRPEDVLKVEDDHIVRFGPKDVLIRVYASSVNSLDCQMRLGKFQTHRPVSPLVLGRDCSGEVVAVGDDVTSFLPGDLVFAAIPLGQQGSHSQLVAVNEEYVAFKPSNVNHKEAASLPWIACTTWSALVKRAGLNQYNTRGKKILVLVGDWSVGSFAVQLLKAWGGNVTVACKTQTVALAHNLGADKVVDCTAADFKPTTDPYDVMFDLTVPNSKAKSMNGLMSSRGGTYISLNSPEVSIVNKLGPLFGGLAFSWWYRWNVFTNLLLFGRSFYFSVTEPNGECLQDVSKMVEAGKIKPVIEAVFDMEEIVDAHKQIETRNGESQLGAIVLTVP